MTDTPSTLDAWNSSMEDELTKLLRRAATRGRLTQHDVVRALPNVELTPEVVEEILRRCRQAGIKPVISSAVCEAGCDALFSRV